MKKKPSARLQMQRWEVEVGGRARWQMKAAGLGGDETAHLMRSAMSGT
jgi:hypothetical protein